MLLITSNKNVQIFRSQRIIRESSWVNTPQHNDIVEIKNRHILSIARAVRFQANIPKNSGLNAYYMPPIYQ